MGKSDLTAGKLISEKWDQNWNHLLPIPPSWRGTSLLTLLTCSSLSLSSIQEIQKRLIELPDEKLVSVVAAFTQRSRGSVVSFFSRCEPPKRLLWSGNHGIETHPQLECSCPYLSCSAKEEGSVTLGLWWGHMINNGIQWQRNEIRVSGMSNQEDATENQTLQKLHEGLKAGGFSSVKRTHLLAYWTFCYYF